MQGHPLGLMLLHGLHGDEMEAERMLLAQARPVAPRFYPCFTARQPQVDPPESELVAKRARLTGERVATLGSQQPAAGHAGASSLAAWAGAGRATCLLARVAVFTGVQRAPARKAAACADEADASAGEAGGGARARASAPLCRKRKRAPLRAGRGC